MKLENCIAKLAERAELPPDGGPLREKLIMLDLAFTAGDITWKDLERELDEIHRNGKDDNWTP